MTPELFNTYVDRFIGTIIIFVFLAFVVNFCWWINEKRKQRKAIKEQHYQDLIDSANRKIQVVNRQIQSLDRCSKEIESMTETLNTKTDSFITTLQNKLLQYKETTSILREIDESIRKSVSIIRENTLMNGIEGLTELIDKKTDSFLETIKSGTVEYAKDIDASIQKSMLIVQENSLITRIENFSELLNQKTDSFIDTIEKNTLESKNATGLLKKADAGIHLSATQINESAIILEKRDRELKEEINCLLSLEGKTTEEIDYLTRSYNRQKKNKFGLRFNHESELSYHLDYPINILPIPQMAKQVLKEQFGCVCVEDVLSMMLLKQRRGMLTAIRYIGKKSITELEDYLCEIGLLVMVNRYYTSPLSI
jgi:hypothetical protein